MDETLQFLSSYGYLLLLHGLEFAADPRTIPGARHLPAEELDRRGAEIPREREVVLFCT